jgi:hypothetical protein
MLRNMQRAIRSCEETLMKTCYLVSSMTLVACAQIQPPPDAVNGPKAGQAAAQTPEMAIILTGDLETPPVTTVATGRALIFVDDDGMVSGVIEAPGMADSAAAIEDDAEDADGPLVVMLTPIGDSRWQVPAGTQLTAKQQAHYESGKLYANVRSKAHPKGEVRAQLQGKARAKPGASTASAPASK